MRVTEQSMRHRLRAWRWWSRWGWPGLAGCKKNADAPTAAPAR